MQNNSGVDEVFKEALLHPGIYHLAAYIGIIFRDVSVQQGAPGAVILNFILENGVFSVAPIKGCGS